MSKLDELIKELCPEGASLVEIGNYVKKVSIIKRKQINSTVEYQYIDLSSVDRDTHQITETSTFTSESAPSRAQQIEKCGDILFGATHPMLKRYCMIGDDYDGQICRGNNHGIRKGN